MNKQAGQSLVEMGIFVAFIVAPLMLLVPYFSKLIEARHYNDMAARYVAWERTVWFERAPGNWSRSSGHLAIKSTPEVVAQVPHRIINGHESLIFSDASAQTKKWHEDKAAQHYRFNQAGQDDSQFLLADYNDGKDQNNKQYMLHTLNNERVPGRVTSLLNSAMSVLKIGGLSLETRGMYSGTSKIKVNSHKLLENVNGDLLASNAQENKRLGQFELEMESKNYIVADGWNAGSQRHNRRRVKSLVPANLLNMSLLNNLRRLLSNIPIARPIRPSSLKLGHTDVEKLPAHRTGSNTDANDE
ncbi:hypothetical protein [Pseudoalteromonas sp. BDTF-M6]|uniref:hypothetical protein n=1 Tax=Pseudoalteromonas sp. BDTF-M6 TaxID=2796132 RepID=UPI001BAF70CD|nr:hypothetical protein [Pseudoalteromonas sp. BDTF-M6]MBS3796829.1 hypothetical protein [Pseudoalteromonas sp. BDTF-M6]